MGASLLALAKSIYYRYILFFFLLVLNFATVIYVLSINVKLSLKKKNDAQVKV